MDVNNIGNYSADLARFIQQANRHATDGVGDATVIRAGREYIGTKDYGMYWPSRLTLADSPGDKAGGFAAIFRSRANKDANDNTRKLFACAVAKTFGGVENIPDNVVDAMKMNDYGKGRPLTARRILAVKKAIDSAITAEIRASDYFQAKVASFGYAADQEVSLAKAAMFYQQAMHCRACTRNQAIDSACSPTGVANRLMNCGGRFMENKGNFRHGVRLIEKFDAWFRGVCDGRWPTPDGASPDLLEVRNLEGFAHFVFADIAHNASTKLAELRWGELVDFANNPVASFFGRGAADDSLTATLLQVPPEKRGTIFRAYNALWPRPDDLSDTVPPGSCRIFIARMLKHLDALIALEKSGKTLTAVDVGRTCFPEIAHRSSSQTFNSETIDAVLLGGITRYCLTKVHDQTMSGAVSLALLQRLTDSGEEFDRVINAYENNKSLSNVPYQASYSGGLGMLNGSTTYARDQFLKDFCRDVDEVRQNLELHLHVSRTDGGNELPVEEVGKRVADKIETLCGKGNVRQATAVLLSLSQSGLANLVYLPGMAPSNVQRTVSHDLETGTFTIEYSNTPSTAVKFSWKTTIERNGNTTVTPMKIRNR